MDSSMVTLKFSAGPESQTLKACLEQLLDHLNFEIPEETNHEES